MAKKFLTLLLLSVIKQFELNAQTGVLIKQSCANGMNDAFFAYYDDFDESINLYDYIKDKKASPIDKSVIVNISGQTFFHFSRDFDIYPMYLCPGDTVSVQCVDNEEYKYKFGGSRSHHELILLTLVNKKFGYIFSYNSSIEVSRKLDFEYIYEQNKEKYERALQFVGDYSKHNSIAKSYYETVVNDLRFNFYFSLLFPYFSTKINNETSQIVPESYKAILRKLIGEVDNQYIYLRGYKQFVRVLNRFLTMEKYGRVDFYLEMETAKGKFDGETREYIMFKNLVLDLKKQVTDHSSILLQVKSHVKNPNYISWIDKELKINGYKFNNEEFSTQLVDVKRTPIDWGDILKQNLGSIVYVDIWASWCAPCIAEFPFSAKLISRYKSDKVKFIFISIDDDIEKWLRSVGKNSSLKDSVYHYCMNKNSVLSKFLDVPPIPRYLIIDGSGAIVSFNAYRPSEPLLIDQIDKLLGR